MKVDRATGLHSIDMGKTQELQVTIYDLLYSLGVTANYSGFFHTSYAVYLTIQQPERLLLITKWLYPDVARQYHTTWTAVERNIRTVVSVAWKFYPDTLRFIAKYPLDQKPSNSRFILILAHSVRELTDQASVECLTRIS